MLAHFLPCRMTLHDFNRLSNEVQLAYVCRQGAFLSTRYDEADVITLHHLPNGMFAELSYDARANRMQVYPFADAAKFEYYAMFVKLPEWLT